MTHQLTPFEIAQLGRIDSSIIYSIAGSTVDLVETLHEAQIQVDTYRALLLEGEEIDADERAVTGEAMKEMREANQKLITMANILEEKFNISA